ncbi:hypothetical protein D9M70_533310 [compost metagenome]
MRRTAHHLAFRNQPDELPVKRLRVPDISQVLDAMKFNSDKPRFSAGKLCIFAFQLTQFLEVIFRLLRIHKDIASPLNEHDVATLT